MPCRRACLWLLVLVALLAGGAIAYAAADAASQTIHWHQDLDAAHQVSLAENKPMLVVISADWCRHCRSLWQQTLTDRKLSERVNDSFVPVHLDFDRHKRIAKILEVESIPCSIVLSPQADLLAKMVGHVQPERYERTLRVAQQLQQRLAQSAPTRHLNTP